MKSFKSNRIKPYLYLAPMFLFVAIFIGYGVAMAVVHSVTPFSASDGWTLHFYGQLYENDSFIDSFLLSIRITVISTLAALLIGMLITKWLYHFLLKKRWKVWLWLPLLFPHFVAAYLMLLLFAQGGWFSGLFYELGWLSDPSAFPILVNDRFGIGMILTYVWKETPFVVLMLLPVYQGLDARYRDVVRTLGGGRFAAWKTAELPWILPVLMETGVILFAFIIAAFEVPYLLGVTYPKMFAVLAYQWFYSGDWSHRPLAFALMITVTAISLLLAFVAFRSSQRLRYRVMKGRSG
ncbi:MAG TPA: ABC transporter permease [Bacillales bacterium]